MIVVLQNGKKIQLEGKRCNVGYWTDSFREYSNQIGIDYGLSVSEHLNILSILAEVHENKFLLVGKKIIPIRSILYLEEEEEEKSATQV